VEATMKKITPTKEDRNDSPWTNKILFDRIEDIRIHERAKSILYCLEYNKMKEFYRKNIERYESISGRIKKIAEDHFVFENGEIKTEEYEQPGKEEGQPPLKMNRPVMLPGKTFEEYDKLRNEIFSEKTTVLL
jgi:hypothetical protein